MIGYTGPIRCLRLYRTVILPRYSACAHGNLISAAPFYSFYTLRTATDSQWLTRKSCRNKSLRRVSKNTHEFGAVGKL